MPPKKQDDRSQSSTPIPSTEYADPAPSKGPALPDAQYEAMSQVLNHIYDYRTPDGFDPSKLFHRKVNKRVIPEYYDTIKEPVALSTIKQKIMKREYSSFSQFVRDFALIPHNAQVFNRPDSGAFQDALVIRDQLVDQLRLLVEKGLITAEIATLPYLGEIPTYEDVPMEDAEGGDVAEEESSADEGEDDEEDEEDDDGRRKKRKGPRGASSISKREAADDSDTGKTGRHRARPPKLLTPMEARIQAILKGIRKPKNQRGQLMIRDFDRLPDKQQLPEYYATVREPIAYDALKRKYKRKKYRTVEEFMADVNLMFNNAKQFNEDDSQVYKHAVHLQKEAGKLYDIEKAKSDADFADEDGKVPMPNGILHNGDLYKVGDWVHVQNPNDLTKPIPAQIYRTYKAPNGQNMVNVCWYYRPEQTVHRFDKHFFPNEVVKTGRYRDHRIEEIEGKCFIMFCTRYFKGRPRGLPEGMEIYVCEARYNEAAHQFNKIKTWASCLPDEVRDKDYEMDLFDHPRKMKKYPSPLAYLLKDEQKETDELPKPQWGADGAPPRIGAVHRRPRGDRDSPPPEPTPPPPPKRPTPPPRQMPQPIAQNYANSATPAQQPRPMGRPPSFSYTQPQYTQHAAPSPAPRPPSVQPAYTPQTPQAQATPQPRPTQPAPTYQQPATPSVPPNPNTYAPKPAISYREPAPVEVYVLPDQANLSIPAEVREQYQHDEFGRVLFFTAPPVAIDDSTPSVKGHSIRYLAEKARRKDMLEKKRKAREMEHQQAERVSKKAKLDNLKHAASEIETLKRRALHALERQMAETAVAEMDDRDLADLSAAQITAMERQRMMETGARKREESRMLRLDAPAAFADDIDNRVVL
ncbi:chromatin structure-remodeling complex subunit rsc1-like [Teratosphaeria destructans]|uniref:Chromatin structure-remodeling complex subunit rsc1-like n=1 Tax=Teratosphaeria destructans TaxID=418781 RepID=A0A9W7SNR3_9PEZI|nr:chromatin structure-remodeling complex subunit rsc1-like [Teratosphaeria destructans]